MNSIKEYSVTLEPRLKKSLKKCLPSNLLKTFEKKIKYLAQNPFHPGLNTKQIRVSEETLRKLGVDEVWEFYINRKFRCIIYVVHVDNSLIISFVGKHDDVVRKYGK